MPEQEDRGGIFYQGKLSVYFTGCKGDVGGGTLFSGGL